MLHADAGSGPLIALVLGGTSEGFALGQALAGREDIRAVNSLAGRTADPRLPPGETRIGGFGGAEGLAAFIGERNIGAVVDATHPFSATMGWNAAAACRSRGVPLLRLDRPAWQPAPGDDWHQVDDWLEAAHFVAANSRRVLLAVGRRELDAFAAVDGVWFLVRSVGPPQPMPAFDEADLLLARGPFDLQGERELLTARQIDTIVCRNSGGAASEAKLEAARELGVRVVIRRRPARPELPTVASVADAVTWLSGFT
jgi:precorrin-6A/cobalt-precorrin-6A reductase